MFGCVINVANVKRSNIMKRVCYIILSVLLFGVVLSFVTMKKTIDLSENGLNVKIPSILITGLFKNYEIQVSEKSNSKKYLNLLYTTFDAPLILFPSRDSNAIFVMYFFDIEDHVFAIELGGAIGDDDLNDMHKSIKRIVTSSNGFKVRYLTEQEIEKVSNELNSMPEDKYKKLSIPSLDLGFYKFYMPKSRVLEMLQKDKKRLQGEI